MDAEERISKLKCLLEELKDNREHPQIISGLLHLNAILIFVSFPITAILAKLLYKVSFLPNRQLNTG
jgi:hypothetical protein